MFEPPKLNPPRQLMTTERLAELYKNTAKSIYKDWESYEKHRQKCREWAQANREKHNGYMREWYNKDPKRARAILKRSAIKRRKDAANATIQAHKDKNND